MLISPIQALPAMYRFALRAKMVRRADERWQPADPLPLPQEEEGKLHLIDYSGD